MGRKWGLIVDAPNAEPGSQNIQRSLKSDSNSAQLSCSDQANLLQLIAALNQLAQTQSTLTQAVDYLIGQNQQLLELVIQQQEIDKESAPGDSLD